MYAAAIVVPNGLDALIREPGSLKSSNEFAAIAVSPDRERLDLGAHRDVGALEHVGVHRQGTPHVRGGELLRRGHRVHVLRPGLGPLGLRSSLPGRGRLAQLVGRVVVPAAAEVEPFCAGGDARVRRRLRPGVRLERRLGELRAEPVAALVGVPARLPVAEPPVVERRDVAGAPLDEQALDPRQLGLDRRAQRCRVLGVPLGGDATDRDRVGGEVDDGCERRTAGVVDADDRHRVVDGPLALHPVDAETRRVRHGRADARRPQPPVRGEHRARDEVRQNRGVGLEPGRVLETGDARSAREARRAVVVRRVDEHGLGRDPGQLPGRARGRRPSGRGRRRRGPSSRAPRCAPRPRARAPARRAARARRARGSAARPSSRTGARAAA